MRVGTVVVWTVWVALGLIAPAPAPAAGQCQPRWVQRFDVPAARRGCALAYDAARGEVVMFGGDDDAPGMLTDTWVWDGAAWTLRTAGNHPTPSVGSDISMTYDTQRQRVVAYTRGAGGGQVYHWNGTNWITRHIGEPTADDASLAFDSRRGVTVFWGRDVGTWEWDGGAWTFRDGGPAGSFFELAYDENRGVTVAFGLDANNQAQTWEWDGQAWTLRPVAGPGRRAGHTMAYDPVRRAVLVYGGGLSSLRYDDTWAWDGTSWRFVTAGQPNKRAGHGMAYDAARGQMVVFGGDPGPDRVFSDTWTLTGDTWTLADEGEPEARWAHAVAYDEIRRRLVLFGGTNDAREQGDTWEHDGNRWRRVATDGPEPRRGHGMAYDSARRVTVLFGGEGAPPEQLADTWEWDGAAWSLRSMSGPSGRRSIQLAYDVRRGVCVLFGGDENRIARLGDTWEWDGTGWTLRASSGPPARSQYGMCYDTVRERTLIFGGVDVPVPGQPVYFGDTWGWDGTAWTLLATTGPPARFQHVLGFDRVRGVATLFGGLDTRQREIADAWDWNGAHWSQAPVGPGKRSWAAMAYAAERRALILHGGSGSLGSSFLSETWYLGSTPFALGDLNCDCALSAFDIEPFVLALFDPGAYGAMYPDCDIRLADTNTDGQVDAFDIEPFIDLLFEP